MDINLIKQNYSERSLEGLKILLDEIDTLREDVIPVLRDEFIKRNDAESVEKIEHFLASSNQTQFFSNEDAKEYIRTELANGQSMDILKLELKERGINIFEIINEDENLETDAIQYMTNLKEQGVKNRDLQEHLDKEFEVVEGKEDELLKSLKRNGTINILFGILLLIIGCILFMGHLYLGRLPITSLLMIGLGIWRLSRGIKQRS